MEWLAAAALGASIVALVAGLAWWRLRRDIRRILERLGTSSRDPVSSRALYRAVRGLERDNRRAAAEAERLRAAIEGSGVGIVVAEPGGRMVVANPAARELVGAEAGDPVLRTRFVQLLRRVAETGEPEEGEFDLHNPRRVVGIRVVPSGDHRPSGAIGYLQDLTDSRKVDAMRRDFVANAAHELKTPLGALTVLAGALAASDDPEGQARLASRVALEADRMARVIDDIVRLAAVESLSSPHEPVAVGQVLARAVDAVEPRAAERSVTLVGKDRGGDAVVLGSREQLVSAVVNLLSNAIEYTAVDESGGTVWYGARVEEGKVVFFVEDDGIGIAPEHQERIFERFYRVDRARSRTSGGTGLGLSIVRNVARTHGGDVAVSSVLGEGSVFTMTIPRYAEAER